MRKRILSKYWVESVPEKGEIISLFVSLFFSSRGVLDAFCSMSSVSAWPCNGRTQLRDIEQVKIFGCNSEWKHQIGAGAHLCVRDFTGRLLAETGRLSLLSNTMSSVMLSLFFRDLSLRRGDSPSNSKQDIIPSS